MKRFSISISDELDAELKRISERRLDRPSYNQLVREALASYLPTVVTPPAGSNGHHPAPAPCDAPAQ